MLQSVVLMGLHDTQDPFASCMKAMYTEHWEKEGRRSFSLAVFNGWSCARLIAEELVRVLLVRFND